MPSVNPSNVHTGLGIKIRVYVIIKGVAKVRWTESKSRHNSSTNKTEHYTVEYHAERRYLHSESLVVGSMDLPIGTHEYTFSTPLPAQIPSSISDEYGHVSYEVELKLDRPMRIDDVYSNTFTVIHPLNLNSDPSYLRQSLTTEQKTFCCCCCESGPLNSELSTEFSGYAPGQKLHFILTLDNESDRDIEECSVELIRKTSFQSESPEHKTRKTRQCLGTVSLEGVAKYCKKQHKGSFTIPPVPPSTTGPDNIIQVYYYLRAEIETGCFSSNEVLRTGITIGTVPLYASATNPANVITVQPTAPVRNPNDDGWEDVEVDTKIGDDSPPKYGSVVPPTFEEATGMNKPFIDEKADENRQADPYVPKYPVYHNFAVPTAPRMDEARQAKETEALMSEQSAAAPSAPPAFGDFSGPSTSTSTALPYPTANMPTFPSLPYPVQGFGGMPVPGSAARVENNQSPDAPTGNFGWQK